MLGAINAVPPGIGIVDGNAIPYRPEALAKRQENFANRQKADPEAKCYRLGVPRSMYAPYPFQIIQGTDHLMMIFGFAGGLRTVYMTGHKPAPAALKVVERITPRSDDTLNYEATIEDTKLYTRPWKISFPLYRRVEKNAQVIEFKCIEYSEELLYGHLRKPSNP
jgi:hypothetical protein